MKPEPSTDPVPAPRSAIIPPEIDPTPIFELFRGSYGTELLTAASSHFDLFARLANGPLSFDALRQALQLEQRPAHVLLTALRAFGLLARRHDGLLELTPLSHEHLVPGRAFDVSAYLGLAASAPGVQAMVERLKTNRPADALPEDKGAAFIYREDLESAMETEASARRLTMALAGRARNVAPCLAEHAPMNHARLLLDVGGGTGIYSIACLQKHPGLRAIVWDRPEVLKVTAEMARDYGVEERLECLPGDMFNDPVPAGADAILLSNVLHDWDVPENRMLIQRCAEALPPGGRLLIHDVFLDDDLGGPLPIALYSAALFSLTQGRAYSAAEYRQWLEAAGLTTSPLVPTLIHCGLLVASRNDR